MNSAPTVNDYLMLCWMRGLSRATDAQIIWSALICADISRSDFSQQSFISPRGNKMQSSDVSCSRVIQRPPLRTEVFCDGPVLHRRRTVPGIVCILQHQHNLRLQLQNFARTINFPCHCLSELWESISLKRNVSHKNIIVRFNQVGCGAEKRPRL